MRFVRFCKDVTDASSMCERTDCDGSKLTGASFFAFDLDGACELFREIAQDFLEYNDGNIENDAIEMLRDSIIGIANSDEAHVFKAPDSLILSTGYGEYASSYVLDEDGYDGGYIDYPEAIIAMEDDIKWEDPKDQARFDEYLKH